MTKTESDKSNGDTVDMSKLLQELTSSMKAMNNRTLPTWDITSKNQSIKAHIKSAENMARRLNWSEKETASEIMLSLRGEAKNIADSLPYETQIDLTELKKELLKLLYTEKPKAQILDEFYNYEWRYERQSIPQYAAILRNKLRKMNEDNPTQDNEIFLRSRLLQGIKNKLPEFGATLELMDLDGKDVNELANFAQRKFDIYKLNNELRDENFAAMIADDHETKKAERDGKTKKENRPQNISNHQKQEFPNDGIEQSNYKQRFDPSYNPNTWRERHFGQFGAGSYGRQMEFDQPDQYNNPWNKKYYRQSGLEYWNPQNQYRNQKRNMMNEMNYNPRDGGFRQRNRGPTYARRPLFQDQTPDYFDDNRGFYSRNSQNNFKGNYKNREHKRQSDQPNSFWNNTRNGNNKYDRPYKDQIERGTTIRRNDRVEYLKTRTQEKN